MEVNVVPILMDGESKNLDDFTKIHLGSEGKVLMAMASSSVFSKYYEKFKQARVVILAGSGNNGGDGIVLGYLFFLSGTPTEIYVKDAYYSEETNYHLNIAKKSGVPIYNFNEVHNRLSEFNRGDILIVDAMIGTGFKGNLNEDFKKLTDIISHIKDINRNLRILNIDTPSGYSENRNGFPIDILAEIGCKKWSNLQARVESSEYSFHGIGFPYKNFFEKINKNESYYWEDLPESELLRSCTRKSDSNKYKNGSALFIGGSKGTAGAILLSQKIFHSLGGGISCITSTEKKIIHKILKKDPSIMVSEIPGNWKDFSFYNKTKCMVIGPGLSEEDIIQDSILDRKIFTVLDAGILLRASSWKLHDLCILTPHEGELEKLNGSKFYSFNEKLTFIQKFAIQKNTNLLLKGPVHILGTPGGKVFVRSTPNPKLAVMGTGDLFTGILCFFFTRTGDLLKSVRYSLQFMDYTKDCPKKFPSAWELLRYLTERI